MAKFDPHKNFSYSTVLTAPSPATSGTSLVVQAADGTKFPTPPFNATVWPTAANPTGTNAEIVRVTGVATDTFTIVRAQETTTARSIIVGDQIAATVTAKTLTDVETASTGSLVFNANDTVVRFTVADVNVTSTTNLLLSFRRANIADIDDPGWIYVGNVVSQAAGTFDVLVCATQLGESDDSDVVLIPSETVTMIYQVCN